MIYGKAQATAPQLQLRLQKRRMVVKPQRLPNEMILEILQHYPESFLSVSRWTNYEAMEIINARPKITTWVRRVSFYNLLEGMAGLKYSA